LWKNKGKEKEKTMKAFNSKFINILLCLSLLTILTGVQPVSAAETPAPVETVDMKPSLAPVMQVANTWSPLTGGGINNTIRAMAVIGDNLYVGGIFTQTADGSTTGLRNIARYNMKTKTWSSLAGLGLNGQVNTIVAAGTDLYVGGSFSESFHLDGKVTGLNSIARYDTLTNTWHPLTDNGLNGQVLTITATSTVLYVGGGFSQSHGGATSNLNHIARYGLASGVWSTLPNQGLNNSVSAFAIRGNTLYVGGSFIQTFDGSNTNLNRIAKYGLLSNSWSALPNNGLNGAVNALHSMGDYVFVGGLFTNNHAGTMDLNRIARYDPVANAWSALPKDGLNERVNSLASNGENLYVAGEFTSDMDGSLPNMGRVAKFDTITNEWSVLPNNGVDGNINVIAIARGGLYAGGLFGATGDSAVSMSRIGTYTLPRRVSMFKSQGTNDGWILESTETGGTGGTLNKGASTLKVGDDAANQQYRAVLSFNTTSLPDDATVTKVTLRLKLQGVTGEGNPVTMFGGFMVDIKKGNFGTSALQLTDFNAKGSKTLGAFKPTAVNKWYALNLTGGKAQVNKIDNTQIRLRFKTDDNNDFIANFLSLYSGNAANASKPQLIIEYYIP
jgi:N-acetylneuraminic acid mutarotase